MVLSLEWPFQEQSVRRAKLPQTLEFKDGIASFIPVSLCICALEMLLLRTADTQELVCSSDKDLAAFFSEAGMIKEAFRAVLRSTGQGADAGCVAPEAS